MNRTIPRNIAGISNDLPTRGMRCFPSFAQSYKETDSQCRAEVVVEKDVAVVVEKVAERWSAAPWMVPD